MKVPEGWKNVHLASLLDGQIKNGYSPNAVDYETGYWVLGLGALGENGFIQEEIKPVQPTDSVKGALLDCDDFLVSRSNTPDKVGRSARYKGELKNCSYPDLMMRFRINETNADLDFIEQKLKSANVRNYYKNCAAGSSNTMVKINKVIVEKTPLLLPPLPEQKKIARILSIWDRAIEVTEKLLNNSQQQKKALMQQLLTGKKRLPGFSEEWKITKLGYLIEEIKKTKLLNPEKYELLTVKLHGKGIDRTGKKPNITEGGRPYYIRKQGELIIGRQNLHNGGIGIASKAVDGCIASNAISSFREKNSDIHFMLFLMSTEHFKFTVDSFIGGTGQKEISPIELLKIKVVVPETKEQQKIASVLSAADKEIEILEQKLSCLRQEKKALMQQLLTGKRRVKVDEPEVPEKEAARA